MWRLIPQHVYSKRNRHTIPEMQKPTANLSDILLALQEGLKCSGIVSSLGPELADPRRFLERTPAPPNPKAVDFAYSKLLEVGALVEAGAV